MKPELHHVTAATRESATLMYWLASNVAPLINTAPSHAHMALQSLALLAAARADRIGDRAAARFAVVTGREIERRFASAPTPEPPRAA
ncbi:hypothetical protein FHP25_24845 [Vineibacter terrae]|uniref:Uncharacterized protein n=1 Tax=Vineibacter terrae TaxID=2586908 RepID=A0A5C8PFX4_9HYPH|nr:hypothetical protein [Vineibacter terrae]TXL72526.1 hypothetical protein FHP25_24845 [Vineibacter terrae]